MVGTTVRRSMRAMTAGGMLALASLALAPVASAADSSVDIAGFAFSPQSVTVKVGDTVTWANADAQTHTATADDGTFDTGSISGNTSKSVTVTKAGTFAYHCKIHPTMTATLVVEAAAAPPSTDALVSAAGSGDSRLTWLLPRLAFVLAAAAAWRRFARRSLPADAARDA